MFECKFIWFVSAWNIVSSFKSQLQEGLFKFFLKLRYITFEQNLIILTKDASSGDGAVG